MIDPIYLDKHVLCINKQRGLLSQPDSSRVPCASQLAASWLGGRASTVHRLDKRATGCLLLARTQRAATRLAAAFAGKCVVKHYLVVAHAHLPPARGQLRAALRRNSTGRVSATLLNADEEARAGQRAASLGWTTLAASDDLALLATCPDGGHKHQIRAMFGAAGMPLLGDTLYGGSAAASTVDEDFLALHAATLRTDHPIRGYQPLRLRAPLPREWSLQLPRVLVAAAEDAVLHGLDDEPADVAVDDEAANRQT